MLHSTNDFNEDFGIKDDDESISDHLDQNQNDAATAESEFRRVTKLSKQCNQNRTQNLTWASGRWSIFYFTLEFKPRFTLEFYHIFHRKLFNFIVILHIKTKTFIIARFCLKRLLLWFLIWIIKFHYFYPLYFCIDCF